MTGPYKHIELKGGKDADLFEQGIIKGNQASVLRDLIKHDNDINTLFTKINEIPEMVDNLVCKHQKYCPMKEKYEQLQKEKDSQTIALRWFIGTILTIVGISVSVLTALKILKN